MVNNYYQRHAFPEQTQASVIRRSVLGRPPASHRQLDWNFNTTNDSLYNRRVTEITDIVYERLLTRSAMPLASSGTVRTLPGDNTTNLVPLRLAPIAENPAVLPPLNSTELLRPEFRGLTTDAASKQTEGTGHDTLVDELNAYLRHMNLEPLSEQEGHCTNLNPSSKDSRPLPIDNTSQQPTEAPARRVPRNGPERAQRGHGSHNQDKSTRTFDWGLDSFSMDRGLVPLGLLQLVTDSARLSMTASQLFRGDGFEEMNNLSRRLSQYSSLLQTASHIIGTAMPAGVLQNLGLEILDDSQQLMKKVVSVLEGCAPRGLRILRWAITAVNWDVQKRRVAAVIEHMESLKSTLSVMLQLHELQLMERHYAAINTTPARSLVQPSRGLG